jgi:hypothetical protein
MTDESIASLRRGARAGMDVYSSWERPDFLPDTVGSAGEQMLAAVARALILGAGDDDEPLLVKAHAWLEDSAARDERTRDHPAYHAMLRAQALGLSGWLLGEESREHFSEAVRLQQEHLRSDRPDADTLHELHLPDLVRDCLAADRPALGAEIYERLVGPHPDSSADVHTPLELAGWLCKELSGINVPADWVAVGERVLAGRLLDELERGRAVEIALWLKLVYADSGAAVTPTEALRRGGQLAGARPEDPLARLLHESLGDPVDLDLFTGFLASVAAYAVPGGAIRVDLAELPPVTVSGEPLDDTRELDEAVAVALREPYDGDLADRLAAAVRGRLVAPDGVTPVVLAGIRIS